MADKAVTDPALLAQLNGGAGGAVTDPAILSQLNGGAGPAGSGQPQDQAGKLGSFSSELVRPLAEGTAAIPLMAADAGVAARNLAGDAANSLFGRPATPDYEMPSAMFQRSLDSLTQKPEGVAKAIEFANSALVGGFENPTSIGIKALDEVPLQLGRQAVVREAHQVGYTLPPSETGHAPGAMLESMAGKPKMEREVSAKNAEVTNRLVKTALGLHPDHPPLSPEVLDAIRSEASKPYDALAGIGEVKADEEFMSDVAGAGADFSKIDRAFPNEPGVAPKEGSGVDASQIESLKGKYFQPRFTAQESIDAMRQLRKDSSANLKVYDPNRNALGMVQRQISDAFEARLGRQAEQMGNKGLVDGLRKARVRIAQTYAVEDAMNKATGNVSAVSLGRLFQNGAPLTGELQTIARAGLAFPKSMKDVDKLGKEGEFSVVDFLVAAGAYLHNPSLAVAIVARPGIRKALQSKMAQKMATADPSAGVQSAQQALPAAAVAGNQTLQ